MGYDVDHDYEFEEGETGFPVLPKGTHYEGNLLVLPNGKYLPSGAYEARDGNCLIYEPRALSPYADMLAEIHANGDGDEEEDEWEKWGEEGE